MSAEFLQSLFGLDGQVCVVVGATGVLGGALAEGLADAGAHVVVAGRSAERGAARVEAIEAAGGSASFLSVDVGSRASLESLLAETVSTQGRVDSLVNCAGANHGCDYFDESDEDWERVINANLRATHWGCQIFGKHFAEQSGGGAILNIGSVTSFLPLSRVFAYSASKAAVISLTQNIARELATEGVRVNALCPGFFPAEQNRKILTDDRVESIMRHTPMARFGEPRELVGAAILLLSPRGGSFITGASYYVDGGFTAMTI
jgi:NAD(P)-dependent dehydrogenase (short-subunit alcohol dehydrogenase family)